MKRITLAWALTLCSFITFIACSSPDVGERSVSIIPAPAQMTVGEGTFTIHPGIEIGYADESLKGMGELLSKSKYTDFERKYISPLENSGLNPLFIRCFLYLSSKSTNRKCQS